MVSATISADTFLQWVGTEIDFGVDTTYISEIVSYHWSMGNGAFLSATDPEFPYTYPDFVPPSTNVTLSVTDNSAAYYEVDSHVITINRLPVPGYTGILSAGEDITFEDESAPFYFAGTVVSADWDFGDGSTSSTTAPNLTATLVHKYTSIGLYDVSVSAFDVSGNIGVATTTVPLFSTLGSYTVTKEDYIGICGPKDNARYGDSRFINLVDYLPDYLRGGETEDFVYLFEEFLNEMFDGLDGFPTTATSLNISAGYEDGAGGQGGVSGYDPSTSDANWPRENTYYVSATSANEETDASDVENIAIGNPANYANQKISILEKVQRITELHDPDLIDLEYIQFFANNLGYDIDINRNEVGVSAAGQLGLTDFSSESPCLSSDSDKYLRFTVRNLPTWYKIKTTDNAIKVMLYSFGLVGELIEFFTDSYSAVSDGGKWRLDYTGEFTDIPDGWFPTPHFSISVNIDESVNITDDVNRRRKIIDAVESVRPINTVFKNLSAYLSRVTNIFVGTVMRMRRYIKIEPDGWANDWQAEDATEVQLGTPPMWESKPL